LFVVDFDHVSKELIMADKPVAKVDELSTVERLTVVVALELSLTSFLRSAKAAKSDAVRRTFEAEAAHVRALLARFAV